ncbi:MAG: penicillin-binding protein activator [Betaproteobacteria bacterium]|jgi:hypothetical protein
MQRLRFPGLTELLWSVALLYGAVAATAIGDVCAQTQEAADEPRPHIAALLPTRSETFARLADALRRGIEAGYAADEERPDRLPVILYATGDDSRAVVDTYDRALRDGAVAVIGPLTRSSVQALAASGAVTVPTLALSVPDPGTQLPDNMYALGVHLESEARQAARLAQRQGKRRAEIIQSESALSRRMAQAFADEFGRGGRLIVGQQEFSTDKARLKKIRDSIAADNADAIFFSLDGPRLRQIRPFLGRNVASYATSQANSAEGTVVGQHDLAGILFVDMPWMVAPDHPAVMIYPRLPGLFATFDQERFYALGIDAWRLSQMLLETAYSSLGTLDGVSGYIAPGPGRQFLREAIPAQFTQGGARALTEQEIR